MIQEDLKKIILGKKEAFADIIGQEKAKQQIRSTLMTGRNVIILGAPGIGKTTMAKSLAKELPEITINDCPYHCLPKKGICPICKAGKVKTKKIKGEERFVRIQGSPDLTVEDLLGDIDPIKALKFGPLSLEAFTPGKIFKANQGVLFFDELNRCPEKLQNALLQVLQEGKATLGSYDVDFPANFAFIATMNPEDSSTEKLSEVLLDRFDIVYMDYPESLDVEKEIVLKKGADLGVKFPEKLLTTSILFVRNLRADENIEKKPSVRASLGLYERAQANCILRKAKEVNAKDIIEAVESVLSHRISLKPSVKYLESPKEYVKEKFEKFKKEQESMIGMGEEESDVP